MYVPDETRIFEDLDYSDQCEDIGCSSIALVGKHNNPVCDAHHQSDCPRVRIVANGVREFIDGNQDMFNYIMVKFGEQK